MWLQNTTSNRQIRYSRSRKLARQVSLITMSAHRRKHMSETLSAQEHNIDGKTWRVELVSDTIHELSASLSLIDTSKSATGQSLKDLNRLVRQAHCEASDKLHYLVISDLVFVSFQSERCRFSIGYLCVGTERLWTGVHFLALSSQSCMIIRFGRNSSGNAGTRRDRIHTTLAAGNCARRL